MSWLRRAGRSVWDFVVGDDPPTAVGVVVALGSTAAASALGVSAWWITPLVVMMVLVASLRRAAR